MLTSKVDRDVVIPAFYESESGPIQNGVLIPNPSDQPGKVVIKERENLTL